MKKNNITSQKSELLNQLSIEINNHEFDYESFDQISFWLDLFTEDNSEEDKIYLTAAINLIGHENPLIFAYFEKTFNETLCFNCKVDYVENDREDNPIIHHYKSMMESKILNFLFTDPVGSDLYCKLHAMFVNVN